MSSPKRRIETDVSIDKEYLEREYMLMWGMLQVMKMCVTYMPEYKTCH
jgi:hypothetical protein